MPQAKSPVAEPSVDAALVRELAAVLNETGLTEVEVERGELRIRITKASMLAAAPAPLAYAAPPAAAASASSAPALAAAGSEGAAAAAGEVVKSPMVGTVYLQPQPGAAAFCRVGDTVTEGQTLLLIEAMKTMNPIAAPKSGTLAQLMVGDGQPVEFGEPLLVIA